MNKLGKYITKIILFHRQKLIFPYIFYINIQSFLLLFYYDGEYLENVVGTHNDILWGSDNICIRKKKKFGGKKLVEAPVYGALAFLGGKFMQKWEMVGIGGKWSKIGFYFA